MSDPYRTSAPKPPIDESPKTRVPWLLVAHVAFTIAWCYATSYLLWKGIAPWADFVNISIALLLMLGVVPHLAIIESREKRQ